MGIVQCGHFANKGAGVLLHMWTSALFDAKNSDFSKFMLGVRTDKEGEGLSQCGHFSDKGERCAKFSRFCADVFMDGL